MKNNQSQSGNVILVVIIVAVIAVLGGLGFVFWQNTSKPAANNIVVSEATAKINSAATLVNKFYSEIRTVDSTNSNSAATISNKEVIVNKYGTAKFLSDYSQLNGDEVVMCTQNYGVSGSSDAIKVPFQEQTVKRGMVNVSVDVVDDGGLKIDAITCPAGINL